MMDDDKTVLTNQEDKLQVVTSAQPIPVVMSSALGQSVIHTNQSSVIQATPVQTVQVQVTTIDGEEHNGQLIAGGDNEVERKKRQEILSRRPSYRRILNDLSSDTRVAPRIEEEPVGTIDDTEQGTITISTANALQTIPAAIVSGAGGTATIQLANSADGLQTLTMTNAGGVPAGTIVQSIQTQDGPQQIFVPAAAVNVARLGDVQYQIRPATSLPQGVVMATTGSLHSQTQLAEEATRKRELRLMKNREAAKECRRKKKEYIKCLENRVAVLENQNKMLIEELKSLKELYCNKPDQ